VATSTNFLGQQVLAPNCFQITCHGREVLDNETPVTAVNACPCFFRYRQRQVGANAILDPSERFGPLIESLENFSSRARPVTKAPKPCGLTAGVQGEAVTTVSPWGQDGLTLNVGPLVHG